jgi:large subunit ribosomal protein L22
MEIIAFNKSVRVSPRKVRLVADAVRKMSLGNALNSLAVIRQRAAIALHKTLKSAVANAKNNAKLEEENLIIKTIDVSEGPALKRFRPSTRGRVHPYKKRTSNIRVVLADKKSEVQNQKSETIVQKLNVSKKETRKEEK